MLNAGKTIPTSGVKIAGKYDAAIIFLI